MIGRCPGPPGPWEGWSGPVRWLTLVGIALFLAWAAGRLSEPQRWLWWETELTGAATKVNQEHLPAQRKLASAGRRAPVPDAAILAGAKDGEPFWAESAANPLRSPHIELRRRDADARYHLLLLVRAAIPETLLLDAEPSPSWTELLESPSRHRGRLLRVQGHCFGLRRMALSRSDVPGLTHCYQAFLSQGSSEPRLLVLFSELPKADLPPEPEWARFWRRDVTAAGYFLKVVRLDSPVNGESATLPVLVARTLLMPPAAEEASSAASASTWWVFVGMAGPLLLLLIGLSWRWWREDRPLLERRQRMLSRQKKADYAHFSAWAEEHPMTGLEKSGKTGAYKNN